jgi:3-phenylpropionate/trans-cinnamate dioxygenase ferredoxin subunit
MTAVRVASVAEVPEGASLRVDAGGEAVCLVNLGADGFRALGDVCSHAEAYLSEGEVDVDEGTVECPLHGSVFDVSTGAAKTLPATRPVPVYAVTVEGDDLMIEVDD